MSERQLIRFWFECGVGRGIGVTAYSIEDAASLLESNNYVMDLAPDFGRYTENVDVDSLDHDHVILNMGICVQRGIWFPDVG